MIALYFASLYITTLIVAVAAVFSNIVGWRWWQPPMILRIKSPAFDKFCCRGGLHRCRPLCNKGCCWGCVRCDAEKEGKLTEHYANIYAILRDK